MTAVEQGRPRGSASPICLTARVVGRSGRSGPSVDAGMVPHVSAHESRMSRPASRRSEAWDPRPSGRSFAPLVLCGQPDRAPARRPRIIRPGRAVRIETGTLVADDWAGENGLTLDAIEKAPKGG